MLKIVLTDWIKYKIYCRENNLNSSHYQSLKIYKEKGIA